MPHVQLPDGSFKDYNQSVSIMDIARDIGPGLAKATLAGKVDGKLVDASYRLNSEDRVSLKIITAKDKEGLEILRHSTAHLLAQAVKQLYPECQVTIGPVVEDGFFYDFACEKPFSDSDLEKIEARMVELTKTGHEIVRYEMPKEQAIDYFRGIGEYYKATIIEEIPDDIVSLYKQGDFVDLCRGPHVPSTDYLKSFKLLKVAGAYWRGDARNEMLQRIYGTAWPDKKSLKNYLTRLAEAQKRDHRKLGKQLQLFHFQETSPGIAFWHPKGVRLWRVIEDHIRQSNDRYGCEEIRTPLIADLHLWEQSGHKAKYAENMFMTRSENKTYAIKPMNCPACVQVYNQYLHSYRDLPVRMTEFGIVHRNEASGALHGLLRVRSFTQDDGHIFCREDQIEHEVIQLIEQAFEVYKNFGFVDYDVYLALRPENRIGDDKVWDKAESALAQALDKRGVSYHLLAGEGAFYGPKIEFHLRDALGRSWQCGTVQVDFAMPARLEAVYVDSNSERRTPVIIHRAIVGSFERFIGMLLEHYAGKLPVWLAPVQAVLIGITNGQDDYLKYAYEVLRKNGLRVEIDLRNEKIGFKIREHTLNKIPFMLVAGKSEEQEQTLSVRKTNGEDIGTKHLTDVSAYLAQLVSQKA